MLCDTVFRSEEYGMKQTIKVRKISIKTYNALIAAGYTVILVK